MQLSAQTSLTGEYRPRAVFNNGYKTPLQKTDDPDFFISQRSRVSLGHIGDKYEIAMTMQDVRVWGDESQISDVPSLSMFNSWVALKLKSSLQVKIGRQTLIYDDKRLFASLNWAQQGGSMMLLYRNTVQIVSEQLLIFA